MPESSCPPGQPVNRYRRHGADICTCLGFKPQGSVSHPGFENTILAFGPEKDKKKGQGIGERLRHPYAVDAEKVRKPEQKGKQDQGVADNQKKNSDRPNQRGHRRQLVARDVRLIAHESVQHRAPVDRKDDISL